MEVTIKLTPEEAQEALLEHFEDKGYVVKSVRFNVTDGGIGEPMYSGPSLSDVKIIVHELEK